MFWITTRVGPEKMIHMEIQSTGKYMSCEWPKLVTGSSSPEDTGMVKSFRGGDGHQCGSESGSTGSSVIIVFI